MIGFLFAGDLVSGLTASAFEETEEIELQTFEDLRKFNVTLHLIHDPMKTEYDFYQAILKSKVKYKVGTHPSTFDYLLMRILKFKNIAFSAREGFLDYNCRQKFVVNNKCGYRVSSFSEKCMPR